MPSSPILLMSRGARPSRAAAVSAFPALPPPCVCAEDEGEDVCGHGMHAALHVLGSLPAKAGHKGHLQVLGAQLFIGLGEGRDLSQVVEATAAHSHDFRLAVRIACHLRSCSGSTS